MTTHKVPTLGATFSTERSCERYTPIFYAAASGDFNVIHIDAEAGQAAGLGGTILQGMCTLAWAVEAGLSLASDPGKLKRVRARFSRPVVPGDVIRFDGTVTRVDGARATAELKARNQSGEDVLKAVTFEVEL